MEKSIEKVVAEYLRVMKFSVAAEECEKRIYAHPEYPALLSITDALESIGIKCLAVTTDSRHLADVAYPCLVQTNANGGELILLKHQQDWRQNERLSSDSLTVIQCSINSDALITGYKQRIYNKRIYLISSLLLLGVVLISAVYHHSTQQVLFILLATFGLLAGYSLVAKQLGMHYRAIDKFCSDKTGNNACEVVLNSDAKDIVSGLSLAGLVLSYFSCQLFCLLVHNNSNTSIVYMGALFVPVVIPYSLYYQWKLSSWCRLCMCVVGIILMEAGMAFMYVNTSIVGIYDIVVYVTMQAVFLAAIVFIMEALSDKKRLAATLANAWRIKHAMNVFIPLLKKEDNRSVIENIDYPFIGNQKAGIVITIISNLHCNPCKIYYKKLKYLVGTYPGKVRVNFAFLTSNPDNKEVPPAYFIINYWANFIENNPEKASEFGEVLDNWYGSASYDVFGSIYSHNNINAKGADCFIRQLQVVNKLNVQFTPTIYINGFKIPDSYDLEDIEMMLPNIEEYFLSEPHLVCSDDKVILDKSKRKIVL